MHTGMGRPTARWTARGNVRALRTVALLVLIVTSAAACGGDDGGMSARPSRAIHHVLANVTRPSTTGLLKTVADEYARYGITVDTIAPGWIGTQNAYDYLRNQVGLNRDEEIAA